MASVQENRNAPLRLDFVTLDVFTRRRYRGNPLAVVFVPSHLGEDLARETKQRIAREFNLSETVFLHVPESGSAETAANASGKSCRVDIFTTETELPFAGHPTIGTAFLVLHHLRWDIDALQLKAGLFPIGRVCSSDPYTSGGGTKAVPEDLVRTRVAHNLLVHSRTMHDVLAATASPSATPAMRAVHAAIATALSSDDTIRQAELHAPVVSIVQGMTALLVRLPTLEHLARVSTASRLQFSEAIQGLLLDEGPWGTSFCYRYYYVPLGEGGDEKAGDAGAGAVGAVASRRFRTRMLELGFEDPATGSAACTLGAYLAITEHSERDAVKFEITQGVELGRRSDITVEVKLEVSDGKKARVGELFLGGGAVVVMTGSIEV